MIAAACGIGESRLLNMSKIGDVDITYKTLEAIGVKVSRPGDNTVYIVGNGLTTDTVPQFAGVKTRAATLFAGLLLNKKGRAVLPLPGGCSLGDRPIDRHLDGLSAMGARIDLDDHGIVLTAPSGLHGAEYTFSKKSHTGTEALIIAGVLARGKTVLGNAAFEPEIDDLITFFCKMGAKIKRVKESIEIEGVKELHGATHWVMPDRNEAVSYACMGIATRGDVIVENARQKDIASFLKMLDQVGGGYEVADYGIRFFWRKELSAVTIETQPEPGFMTDWQPLWTTMMTQAHGTSCVIERVTEHRLAFTSELNRMGADIKYFDPMPKDPSSYYEFNSPERVKYPHAVKVKGPTKLKGANLTIPDLRGGATLVMAAIIASGESVLSEVEHIDRGYENFDSRLAMLSANIKRI